MKVPPPPKVGDRFYGPSASRHAMKRGPFKTVYHVRAVVDVEPNAHPMIEHTYQVVLRHWSARRGWRYAVECQFAFGVHSTGEDAHALYTLAKSARTS